MTFCAFPPSHSQKSITSLAENSEAQMRRIISGLNPTRNILEPTKKIGWKMNSIREFVPAKSLSRTLRTK
jgi:hypothetical protein